jgi:DNA-binding transcriptional LysR family regulator
MDGRRALEADGLRAFAVFARQLNFTSAAALLHLSQPSLHAKIRKLGQALGADLYERDGRGLRLTAAGRRLDTFAQDNARRTDDFFAELHGRQAPITIAAGRGAFRWVLGPGVRSLVQAGRGLDLVTANREEALAAVLGGRADLAVLANDPPPRAVRSAQLAVHPQTLIVPREHRLAGHDDLRLAQLDGLDLVVPPPDRPHRRALDRALLDAGVSWRVAAEVDGWDLLVHFVTLELGMTIVNGCVLPPAGFVAVPVVDLPPVRYWAAWRASRDDIRTDVVSRLITP